jgi:hypothetical protein
VAWAEGRCLIIDDSFEHEVWFTTAPSGAVADRIVLVVDLWHPDTAGWPWLWRVDAFPDDPP